MKTKTSQFRSQRAFTLIEILGVLAIIGALASILIVNVNRGRKVGNVTNAIGTVNAVKNALQSYLQKPGGLGYIPLTSSASAAAMNLTGAILQAGSAATISKACTVDTLLRAEQMLDGPVTLGLGSGSTPSGGQTKPLLWNPSLNTFYCNPDAVPDFDYTNVPRIICQLSSAATPGTDGTNFFLDASLTALAANARVVSLVIPNVLGTDAAMLANQYDNKSSATATAAVTAGRVAYAAPSATTGLTTVYVYVNSY